MEEKEIFSNIAGYQDIKKELLMIRNWFLNNTNLENEFIKLPRGILFEGTPGTGKSLFLIEYAASFDAPKIIVEGDEDNISMEIHKAFEESKKYKFSLILIDEIDLLIGGRSDISRTLQAEMDGVNSNSNCLVLATTNTINRIDNALKRSGRFDRIIEVYNPDNENRKELLKLYINKIGLKGNIDIDYLSKVLYGVSCADIMAILNDVYLRKGNNITTEDIEVSYYRVTTKMLCSEKKFDPSKANIEIAYHEIGHALMCYKNRSFFTFYRAGFSSNYRNGRTKYFPEDMLKKTVDIEFMKIEILLGGHAMTNLKFNKVDGGSYNDLLEAKEEIDFLVDNIGYFGIDKTLRFFTDDERLESETRKRKNEALKEKLILKVYKSVRKYLKKNMMKVDALVSLMMTKGFINNKDLISVMEKA